MGVDVNEEFDRDNLCVKKNQKKFQMYKNLVKKFKSGYEKIEKSDEAEIVKQCAAALGGSWPTDLWRFNTAMMKPYSKLYGDAVGKEDSMIKSAYPKISKKDKKKGITKPSCDKVEKKAKGNKAVKKTMKLLFKTISKSPFFCS